jgi:hypothetical protein
VIEGQLVNTGHEVITLEVKSGDRKLRSETKEIPYDQIKEAYVIVQFGKNK